MLKNLLIISCLSTLFTCAALAGNATYSAPSTGKEFPDFASSTGMDFVFIRGGTYLMGDLNGKDKEASPAHEVLVDDFYMGKYEVTFAQYDQFCRATGRNKPHDAGWGRDNRPVINVDWHDAVAYTEWLSMKDRQNLSAANRSGMGIRHTRRHIEHILVG